MNNWQTDVYGSHRPPITVWRRCPSKTNGAGPARGPSSCWSRQPQSTPVLEELQALCNNWVWSNEGNAKLGLLFAWGQCKRVEFVVGKDAEGISLKWKNCIKHSICINYIVSLINFGTHSSRSSAAGGIGLEAALRAIILEATIHAWGTLKLPVMSLNKWI